MNDELHRLYKERADLVDAESSYQDMKKYTKYGGFFWRLFDWCERLSAAYRQDITDEIELRLNGRQPMTCCNHNCRQGRDCPMFDYGVFEEITGLDLQVKETAPCEGREVEIDGVVYVLKAKGVQE